MIEPLESRIAPASALNTTTLVFTDVDGDLVTVKFSKPIAGSVAVVSVPGPTSIPGSEQLQRLDLSGISPAAAAGVDITFTATPKDVTSDGVKDGDGLVNVGEIRATSINLGAVTVPGDLGRIAAGAGSANVPAIKSLNVGSMGTFGLETGAASFQSTIVGTLNALTVKGDVRDVLVFTTTGFKIGSVTIGGSLYGGADGGSGVISGRTGIDSVKIGGNIVGGSGKTSGAIATGEGGKLGSVSVGGSVIGGLGEQSGFIAAGTIGSVKVGRDLAGGEGKESGRIRATLTLGNVTIGGSLLGGFDRDLTDGVAAGEKSGTVEGTRGIGAVKICGDLAGGSGTESGVVKSDGFIKSVTVLGSMRGGVGRLSGQIESNATTGPGIGPVKIGRDLVGGRGDFTARVDSDTTIASLSIGGSLLAGAGSFSGYVASDADLGAVSIGGDVNGGAGPGFGDSSAAILSGGNIASVTIAGSLIGGWDFRTGLIESQKRIGPVKIGGDIRGGSTYLFDIADTGSIVGRSIDSVSVGGSIIGGVGVSAVLKRSGAISSVTTIGAITVQGDLDNAFITAGGDTTRPDRLALGALSIAGSVANTEIYLGYNKDAIGVNADASAGAVRVGRDWTASTLIAGVYSGSDGRFATDDDALLPTGADFGAGPVAGTAAIAKIASITIGGHVRGLPGTTATSGFGAQFIGAFKYAGVTVPLMPNASNDNFTSNRAHPLGTSLTNLNTDNFAVHVYEVAI